MVLVDIPVVDLTSSSAADEIGAACRTVGFFAVTAHGVARELQARLEQESRAFFAQPVDEKMKIRMALAGRALRGYFPVGGELTSGRPDRKEGLYFGIEGTPDRPMHGANLFPSPELRETVLDYMAALTSLGHRLMSLIAVSLDLEPDYFATRYTARPFTLFRIFNYTPGDDTEWGVGEHTDYGLLTILKQDDTGRGLQIRTGSEWIDVPPVPDTFVCNIGDMLDRLTGGRYRSTPHRVLGTRAKNRLSWPFFFDPGFDVSIDAIGRAELAESPRWDGVDPHAFQGTFGEWLVGKVSKVFPELMG